MKKIKKRKKKLKKTKKSELYKKVKKGNVDAMIEYLCKYGPFEDKS